MEIQKFKFEESELNNIKKAKYGTNWPVVYIINNHEEAYVGETLDAGVRTLQHLRNPVREKLKDICFISDDKFNKSAILDLESFLIRYMSSDELFRLQNSNSGVCDHNYYAREEYEKIFETVWDRLKADDIVKHTLADIENSDLFKYSPYKALTNDQELALSNILKVLSDTIESDETSMIMVEGGAGTGKTILAVFLMKLLSETSFPLSGYELEDYDNINELQLFGEKIGTIKAALVIPMQSLRETLKKVFGSIKGLSPDMVISPLQVPQGTYDLLIVDEAHRLRQRKALAHYPSFDKNNKKFALGNEGTELDWITKSSKVQILFYDELQSIKPSDIDPRYIKSVFNSRKGNRGLTLSSQLRCMGGDDYIDYVKKILSCEKIEPSVFKKYDIVMFDDVQDMMDKVKEQDERVGLSRAVAGFSWKWITKNKEARDLGKHDIEICGYEYNWNTEARDWINSKNAINEIGCIHTVQGYDLNYTGVIFGNEIKYNPLTNEIIVDKKNYHDQIGKTALRDLDQLKDYIINIYITLMTRGIKGTYVYVCDENLREYLRKYFQVR